MMKNSSQLQKSKEVQHIETPDSPTDFLRVVDLDSFENYVDRQEIQSGENQYGRCETAFHYAQ